MFAAVLPIANEIFVSGLPVGVRVSWRAIEIDFQLQDYEGRIVEVFLWPVYIAILLLAVSLGILVASPTSRNHSLPDAELTEDPIENVISVD